MLTSHRPLRVVLLCSQRAPGLKYLCECGPGRGTTYEIACVISSEDSSEALDEVSRWKIPHEIHSIHRFFDACGASVYRDFEARADYDYETVARIEPYDADVVLLAGYRYLVTWPLLARYAGRVLNLHLSDLTLRLSDGRPRFPGLRAVRDAIAAGQASTCATVHLVKSDADAGPPVVRSWPFPVSPLARDARQWQAADMLKAYAYAHQEWMMRAAAGPLWAAALRLVKSGAVDLDALDGSEPARVAPWTLQPDGGVVAPWSDLEHPPRAFTNGKVR